jgi:hypothetical protein
MTFSHGRRKQLMQQLLAAFAAMSATEWELLGHALAEHIAGVRLRHRGLTVAGNPRGYSVDSYSNDARIVAEYGTELGYFEDLSKPKEDFEHARREAPHVETVLLLSNQEAGQTAMLDVAAWVDDVRLGTGILLDVYDANDIGDVILDDVLPRGRGDKIAPYLEPIQRLLKEQAASHQMPSPRPGALPRPALESRIQAELDARHVVLLSGISGLGKSETAVSIATARVPLHDRVVWVGNPHLRSAAELEAIDVAHVGMLENLQGMLATRSCFVVLDDLQAGRPLGDLLDELTAVCGPEARVLITSQESTDRPNDMPMEFLDRDEARTVLEQDVDTGCPDDLFAAIWQSANGHPLTLQLLNASAREGGGWDDVRIDVESVGAMPVLERRQPLANALVARGLEVVEPALALFVYVGSSRVHEGFARAAVGPSVLRALRRLAFVASDLPDTLRLHDIVWSSIGALQPPLQPDANRLAAALHRYVRQLGSDDSGTLALNHVARLHQNLLWSLVSSAKWLDGHLYAWLHHLGPGQVGRHDLPDAIARAHGLAGLPDGTAGDAPADDFAVQVTVELAEAIVRLATVGGKAIPDPAERAELVRPFDILLTGLGVSQIAKHHVQHHRAKALKRLRQEGEAIAALEALLADAGPLPASRLLLGRMLTEPRVARGRPDAGARATELLLGLLAEAASTPERASISVVLAAAELLRRHALGLDLEAAVRRYAQLLETLIVRASERGLEQGVLAFAALGATWLRVDRDQFFRIYRALPLPASRTIDPNEREAWGELLKVVADELEGAERDRTLEQALRFLLSAESRYGISHAADVLVRLKQPRAAISTLEAWFERDEGARSDAWLLLRFSDAQAAAGAPNDAVETARKAYACIRPGDRHRAHFVEQLARRLEEVGKNDEAQRLRSESSIISGASSIPPTSGS